MPQSESRPSAARAAEPQAEAQPSPLAQLLEAAGPEDATQTSEFTELLKVFIKHGIGTANRIEANAIHVIDKAIGDLDEKMSDQLSAVIQAPEFQALEARWRGLAHLLSSAQVGTRIKVRLLDCTKAELTEDFADNPESMMNQSALYRQVFNSALNQYGADPYGLLVGDFEFGRNSTDINLLRRIAQIASVAHAPFISSAAPNLVGLRKDFTEIDQYGDLKVLQDTPEFAAWKGFRESEDARYVGLTLPRFLGRAPYTPGTTGAKSFNFNERVSGRDHRSYLWLNSAYAMAGRIAAAFEKYEWCAAIRGPQGGGKVENLPVHTFESDRGDTVQKCPTEIPLNESVDRALSEMGFIPLVFSKGSDHAAFFQTQSAYLAKRYTTDEANSNAYLSAQLQYTLALSRVAHLVKITMRDSIGDYATAETVQARLSSWLSTYTLLDDTASSEAKAKQPFRRTEVQVSPVPGRPGALKAEVFFKPHYQLDELSADLHLVADIPLPRQQS